MDTPEKLRDKLKTDPSETYYHKNAADLVFQLYAAQVAHLKLLALSAGASQDAIDSCGNPKEWQKA